MLFDSQSMEEKHTSNNLFLVVDKFGVKNVVKDHVDHLHRIITFHYEKYEQYWSGELLCGLTLDWNYETGYINIFMPGYVKNEFHQQLIALQLIHLYLP